MRKIISVTCLVFFLLPILSSQAYWVWSPETGKFVNLENAVQDTAEEQYEYAMQFYYEKDLDEAVKQLENLLKQYPNAGIAPEAQYRVGVIYEERSDFIKAFEAYKRLVSSYPQSERINEVVEREFRIGNLFLSGKKGKFMGLEILPSLPTATEIFSHIVDQAPYSEYGDKAQFHLGLTHKKAGQFQEALNAFQALIDNYPQSKLVSQARFQLAETSFVKSSSQFRNERALEEASEEVNRFLTRYPDTQASEKVASLRQQIDEKNAQKSYRIGAYYEKQNFLSSALIYFRDVAARYPNTTWGQKSAEKLRSLEEPADYVKSQELEIMEKSTAIRTQLSEGALEDSEKERLERELDRLQKREKSLSKSKKESLDVRKKDIKRREAELKKKFKKLAKKRKAMASNQSEEFLRAMDRWQASLEKEREQLQEEKTQLRGWHEEMGMEEKKLEDFIPFMPDEDDGLDKVRSFKAKKLFKVSKTKKELLDEKELLYKQHGEVLAMLDSLEDPDSISLPAPGVSMKLPEATQELQEQAKADRAKLETTQKQVKSIKRELETKKAEYKKTFGRSPWAKIVSVPAQVVSSSVALLNPFDGKSIQDAETQELLERRMHLKEKISAEENLIQTLNEAFNEELAMQERKRLAATFGDVAESKEDLAKLRKSVKRLEKKIRASYQEIDDRHQAKKKLVKQLDDAIADKENRQSTLEKTGRLLAAPFVGAKEFGSAFLFGMKDKEVAVTEKAEAMNRGARDRLIEDLQKEIKLQSLIIQAKSRDIKRTEKEIEILKAKASLAGGYKFRSAIVTVPYRFIGEAIDSAKQLVPKQDRDELILDQLNEHTARMEQFKKQRKEIDAEIKSREGEAPAVKPILIDEAPAKPSPEAMKHEIETLREQLKIKMGIFRNERSLFESKYGTLDKGKDAAKRDPRIQMLEKKKRKLAMETSAYVEELQDIEGQLKKVVLKEKELEEVEIEILEDRITQLDRTLQKVTSKAVSQDLLTERSRIEKRLSQISSRRDFLTQELERFQLPEPTRAQA